MYPHIVKKRLHETNSKCVANVAGKRNQCRATCVARRHQGLPHINQPSWPQVGKVGRRIITKRNSIIITSIIHHTKETITESKCAPPPPFLIHRDPLQLMVLFVMLLLSPTASFISGKRGGGRYKKNVPDLLYRASAIKQTCHPTVRAHCDMRQCSIWQHCRGANAKVGPDSDLWWAFPYGERMDVGVLRWMRGRLLAISRVLHARA